MATFDQIERSEQGGVPVILARVVVGGVEHLFTDCEYDITVPALSRTYRAVPLKTGAIKADVMLQSNDLTLTLPRSETLFTSFFPTMTRLPVIVELRQTHDGADDAPLLFTGSAVGAALDEERISFTITAKNGLYQLNKVGSRRKWQTGCPFVLYGGKCRASQETSKFSGIITRLGEGRFKFTTDEVYETVDDNNIHYQYIRDLLYARNKPFFWGDWSVDTTNFWVGSSVVIAGNTFSSCIYEAPVVPTPTPIFRITDGDELSLFRSIVPSGSVPAELYPDCTRTIACCRGIHRNSRNFGGVPTMPYESPVGVSYIGDR